MDRPDEQAQQALETPDATPAPAPMPADPDDPSHVLLHMPVHVRSMSLMLLAALLVIATLKWAAPFFIPVMIAFLLSYALSPIVDRLQRWRVPRALTAAVLIFGLLASAGGGAWSFSDDVSSMIESLPVAATKLRDKLRQQAAGKDTLTTVQKAASQLEQAAAEAGGAAAPAQRGVQRVVVEKPRFDLREHLWTGTIGVASLVGQVVVVTFLTYFLLISGDTFRRKLVKITGPQLSQKKITVQALDEINEQIQRYLLVQLVSSIIVGVATALSFWALGLKHAAVWGFFGGLLNLIPYIGAIVITAAASIVAFMQFGDLDQAIYIAAASTTIHTIVGYLLVPWWTSRTSRMNAVAVFIGVLAWGWLWGVWGLLLGIPILMIVKAVCDRVDHLKPVGELLGQ
ncbi:AI-2E family transporter [Ramlibacter sp. PS4R-6]|uniref:AI-2E family transporter n=1 Tax=Ramlibacter sp. PS4R-6 TaxID=3133438 RepID=UPI00309751A2